MPVYWLLLTYVLSIPAAIIWIYWPLSMGAYVWIAIAWLVVTMLLWWRSFQIWGGGYGLWLVAGGSLAATLYATGIFVLGLPGLFGMATPAGLEPAPDITFWQGAYMLLAALSACWLARRLEKWVACEWFRHKVAAPHSGN